jgi:hypothetical protein
MSLDYRYNLVQYSKILVINQRGICSYTIIMTCVIDQNKYSNVNKMLPDNEKQPLL